jgi:YesN/AraC family two-component response regulator
MLLNNIYNFPAIAMVRNLDSRFIREDFANDKIISIKQHRLKNNEIRIVNCENEEDYSFKIEIAQQLLLSNSLNISEIAYRIGFNDPKYFSRCF